MTTTNTSKQSTVPTTGRDGVDVRCLVGHGCEFCGYEFDVDKLGGYGCPNCLGEGLEHSNGKTQKAKNSIILPLEPYGKNSGTPLEQRKIPTNRNCVWYNRVAEGNGTQIMKTKKQQQAGIYRKGKTYFRAVWIKSRKHYRFYWLTPGGEVPSSRRYDVLPKGSRRIKNKPCRKQLTASWLIS